MYEIGTHVVAFGKSMHAGQSGTIVRNYGNHYLVEADDPKYIHAHKNSIGDGRYFQVDALLIRQLKD